MTSTVEAHTHQHKHEDLSYAGQGAVLLDIGGDVGALIVVMPDSMAGVEIEICPAGEGHSEAPRSHVAVLGRPAGGEIIHSAVFPALTEGRYELYRKSDGPTELIAEVSGSVVTQALWPTL
jgi:uncharacterized protein YjlB